MNQSILKNKYTKGMTLVELFVVFSIFAVLTTVTFFNYGKFRSTTSLQNLTDDVGLSLRKAQSYATGARGASIGGVSDFSKGYGVHITASSSVFGLSSSKAFVIFSDVSNDKQYTYAATPSCSSTNPSSTNECLEVLTINTGDYIKEVYINGNTTPALTSSSSGSIDVVFLRPNLDASFCYRHVAVSATPCLPTYLGSPISYVTIRLSNSKNDATKDVVVWNTGQISIQ